MGKTDGGYWVHDYYGTNIVGNACHTYELKDSTGRTLYRMNNELLPDGSEPDAPIDVFYAKAKRITGDAWEPNRS